MSGSLIFSYEGLYKVISGGQTGADQAGLAAAHRLGVSTGGTASRGFKTSVGSNPLLTCLGLSEHSSPDYPPRTLCNVRDSDATLALAHDFESAGERLTARYCQQEAKPYFAIDLSRGGQLGTGCAAPGADCVAHLEKQLDAAFTFLCKHQVGVLNVAGNREASKDATSMFNTVLYLVTALLQRFDGSNLLIRNR